MNKYNDKIAITTGDTNGIGAEITIKALNSLNIPEEKIVIISNKKILNFYGKLNKNYEVIEVEFNSDIEVGKITKPSGEFSYQSIKKACQISPRAIVTAPVAKEALHLAGYEYNGQTELLQHFLAKKEQKAEMLFTSDNFNVLLLTRHLALKDILVTEELLTEKITRLKKFFNEKLNNNNPQFALCSLNPHAGENGILGTEEKEIIIPTIEKIRQLGVNITNPLPADTLFIDAVQNYLKKQKQKYDCYIAMYHDQGLIPIKAVASEKTVNMTIGLDIIRTSPAHGTAFDIAGKNIASEKSMIEAIKTAFAYS